ncbi:hypothetical protein CK203_055234 [Vitis vinifera]|uniref:Uncharacterized protein n=1 Tax=Vitis vinifera TaxID=29760 RepID=A0A438GU07_VITVI|nr:hypothetical protein CK203_055234 [Vitis vinifera]
MCLPQRTWAYYGAMQESPLLGRKAHKSEALEAVHSLRSQSVGNQTNGTRAVRPRKLGTDFVKIQWSGNYLPWRRCAMVQVGPIILNVQFSVVEDLSPFNAILRRTWLHYMKVIPSTYHQMVSFLTKDEQIDLYGSQLAARQCYQVAREARPNKDSEPLPEPANELDQ